MIGAPSGIVVVAVVAAGGCVCGGISSGIERWSLAIGAAGSNRKGVIAVKRAESMRMKCGWRADEMIEKNEMPAVLQRRRRGQ